MGNYACAMAITMQKCSRAAAYRFSGLSNSSGVMFSKLLLLRFLSNSECFPYFFFFFPLKLIYSAGKKSIAARAEERRRETNRTDGGASGAPAKVWKRAARRPVERFYESPAACEGLLPHHHHPVTADDLISPTTRETSGGGRFPNSGGLLLGFFCEISPLVFKQRGFFQT